MYTDTEAKIHSETSPTQTQTQTHKHTRDEETGKVADTFGTHGRKEDEENKRAGKELERVDRVRTELNLHNSTAV